MSCFWAIILSLTIAFTSSSEARKSTPPSAVVVGNVYCDACFIPKHSHFISGASVALECNSTFRKEIKTDEHGEFRAKLPFQIEKHTKNIKGCSVKLITSNKPYCSIPSSSSSSSLHLRSRKRGVHIFSAGSFTFKPSNKPCDQNANTNNIKKLNDEKKLSSPYTNPNDPSFPPPLRDPPPSDPPALGRLLPPLLPGIPLLPPIPKEGNDNIRPSLVDDYEAMNQSEQVFPFPPNPLNPPNIFPPNPLQPPPSVIPPLIPTPPPSLLPPLIPTPPPSLIPPIFPMPSPPPLFQLPPLPGLNPLPPPPPPPAFPIPLPPFPFQPSPGFPGIPPAEVSERSSP